MLILLLASVAFTQADTAATKSAILEADRSLAAAVASKGAQVFLDALAPDAAVLFPGQPILKGSVITDMESRSRGREHRRQARMHNGLFAFQKSARHRKGRASGDVPHLLDEGREWKLAGCGHSAG
jgi:ketosteroid isomerase-like protein